MLSLTCQSRPSFPHRRQLINLQLLSSPTFHRAVRRVHKKVHEIRHGEKFYDPSEMGGTKIESRLLTAVDLEFGY